MPLEDLSEAVRRFVSGDASAFQVIVDATSARLVRLGARLMGNVADGEDVVQDAYVKAYRSLVAGRFDGRASIETWLYRIVTNAAIDAMRSRRRRPIASDVMAEGSWDGAASAEARVALGELSEWLSALPPEQKAALVLKSVEGLSSPEIAEILGCSEGAVEQRLVRARSALRERSKDRERIG